MYSIAHNNHTNNPVKIKIRTISLLKYFNTILYFIRALIACVISTVDFTQLSRSIQL